MSLKALAYYTSARITTHTGFVTKTMTTYMPIAIILISESSAFQRSRFLALQHSGKTECSVHCNIDSCRTFLSRP